MCLISNKLKKWKKKSYYEPSWTQLNISAMAIKCLLYTNNVNWTPSGKFPEHIISAHNVLWEQVGPTVWFKNREAISLLWGEPGGSCSQILFTPKKKKGFPVFVRTPNSSTSAARSNLDRTAEGFALPCEQTTMLQIEGIQLRERRWLFWWDAGPHFYGGRLMESGYSPPTNTLSIISGSMN